MEVQDLLRRVTKHLSVSRAFGSAYEKDGTLVIPVAFVAGGGGGGEGTSGSSADDYTVSGGFEPDGDDEVEAATSSGSGGGVGGVVMPVGVYVVKDEQVRWVPAVNANLVIVVAFMTVRLIVHARRRSRRHAS